MVDIFYLFCYGYLLYFSYFCKEFVIETKIH